MFTLRTKWSILKALITRRSPYYIQFFITSRCNLRCGHCNIVQTNSGLTQLSLTEIDMVARNLKAIGAGIVLLSGGEPFLRADLPEIVNIFTRIGLNVRLQTAGHRMATSERLQQCFAAGARDINVSFDSLDPSVADDINGVNGSWQESVRTISRISRTFTKSAICSFGCVLSRLNYTEIPAILSFATAIGWHVSLVPVHIAEPPNSKGFQSTDRKFSFKDGDLPRLSEVFETLIAMKQKGYLLFDSEDYLRSALEFIKTGTPEWRSNGVCDSPDLYFIVRPNGDFAVCADHLLPGSNLSLLSPDFPKQYRSASLRDRVRTVTTSCDGCHYGSYPEVTLSVRSLKTFIERIRLTMQSVRPQLKPYTAEQLFRLIDDIKHANRSVYGIPPTTNGLPAIHGISAPHR